MDTARRSLLLVGIAYAGLRMLPTLASNVDGATPSRRLAETFEPGGSAAAIGQAALDAGLVEADAVSLAEHVLDDLGLEAREVEWIDRDMLRARVAECIRADFAQIAVMDLDGWILSRTEVRLCALAAMMA